MIVQIKHNDFDLKNFIIKTYDVVFQMNEVGILSLYRIHVICDRLLEELHRR